MDCWVSMFSLSLYSIMRASFNTLPPTPPHSLPTLQLQQQRQLPALPGSCAADARAPAG